MDIICFLTKLGIGKEVLSLGYAEVGLHQLGSRPTFFIPRYLTSSQSLLLGFSIQDESTDVAQSTPQGAHYHADVIYLLP